MLNYKKMFEPFTGDGCTFDMCVAWAKEKTGADDRIMELAVAKTMLKVTEGEKFPLPCKCGCGGNPSNVHTPINHDMMIEAYKFKSGKDIVYSDFIEQNQKKMLENQMKRLVNNDKQMLEAKYGTWSDRNIPTFKKWYNKWR